MANTLLRPGAAPQNVNNPSTLPQGSAASALITNAFNHQVYDLNNMDVQHMQLYDTITIAASGTVSSNTVSFFSNVGPQSNKTVAQTNIATPRQLQTPQAFSIMAFRIRWSENILLADLLLLINNLDFEFFIGQKIYQQAPIWNFNAGGGIYGISDVATTSVLTNGYPGREAMHRLNIPLVIDNTAQFYGQLNGTPQTLTASGSGGTGLTIQLLLDGFYARGIQ